MIVIMLITMMLVQETSSDIQTKEVLIIGAGVAGAAAARVLQNAKRYKVTVLESRVDRLGGHIWTDRSVKSAQGPESELGAPWIYEPKTGSIFAKVLDDLELVQHKLKNVRLKKDDRWVDADLSELLRTIQADILSAIKMEKTKHKKIGDLPLSVVIANLTDLTVKNESLSWNILSHAFIAPLFGCSLKYLSSVNFQSGRLLSPVQILDGLDELPNRLIGGVSSETSIDVELGRVARQIKVDFEKMKVKVRTVDRRSYSSDAVILAVPLAVLQYGSIHFDPPLTPDKRKSIESSHIGLLNRVIVEFDGCFWPPDISVFADVSHNSTSNMFAVWVDAYSTTNRPILTTCCYGDYAERLEKLSDDQLETLVLESLSSIFSPPRVAKHKIVSITRSSWSKDQFSRGSSSYIHVGATLAQRRELFRPIRPYLYFAGEYTSLDQAGTVGGAYMSGVEAAEELMHDDNWTVNSGERSKTDL